MLSWNQIKYAGIGFGSALLLLLAWGVLVEPRLFEVKEENAAIPGLPNEWSGQRIALIADLQIGMWFGNEETDRRIVDRIIQEKPAFVLIAGDFVYKPTDEDERDDLEREDTHAFRQEVEGAVALVRPLVRARLPVYAVLGNHDYGMNHPDSIKNDRIAEAVRAGLEGAGIRVLENAALPLSLPNDKATKENSNSATKLYLAGIGSRYAGLDRSAAAVAQIPDGAPRIVFMHNPDSFAALPPRTAPLALAGHTHGGQIRVPFTEKWSWMALQADEQVDVDGWIDGFGQPGNRLYVNRGIGFSTFPVRINCRSELTFFTLHRSN